MSTFLLSYFPPFSRNQIEKKRNRFVITEIITIFALVK